MDAGLRTTRNKPHNKSPIVHLSFHFNFRIAETIITLSMQYIITKVIAYSSHSIFCILITLAVVSLAIFSAVSLSYMASL